MARIMRMPPKSELPDGPPPELRRRVASLLPRGRSPSAASGKPRDRGPRRPERGDGQPGDRTPHAPGDGHPDRLGPRLRRLLCLLRDGEHRSGSRALGKATVSKALKATPSTSSGCGTWPSRQSPILRASQGQPWHPRATGKTIRGQRPHQATAMSRHSDQQDETRVIRDNGPLPLVAMCGNCCLAGETPACHGCARDLLRSSAIPEDGRTRPARVISFAPDSAEGCDPQPSRRMAATRTPGAVPRSRGRTTLRSSAIPEDGRHTGGKVRLPRPRKVSPWLRSSAARGSLLTGRRIP